MIYEKNKKYHLNNSLQLLSNMNSVWRNNKNELYLDFLKSYVNLKKFNIEKFKEQYDVKIIQDEGANYYSIKYNKNAINRNTIKTLGIFRSLTLRNGNIISFSPIKSYDESLFFELNTLSKVTCQEFVEGTMINCFYDKEERDWMVCTRSIVGAETSFNKDNNKTFKEMFNEAFTNMKLSWDMFNREFVYSLVLQHPNNKIVLTIEEPALYLVELIQIQDFKVELINYKEKECCKELLQHIKIPQVYDVENMNFDEIKEKYASMNTDYRCLGIMFKNGFERCKLRNPSYEYLHNLKGNSPKLQYQYYSLRQNDKVKDFLKHYPEYKEKFSEFRNNLHKETSTLWKNYISCFVKHTQPIQNYGYQYRPHMIELHKKYIDELLEQKRCISRQLVINYINQLPVPRLMYFMNYRTKQKNLVQQNNDFKNAEMELKQSNNTNISN